jgi:hypothetical protein
MITSNCPSCEELIFEPIADSYCFQRYECPACKAVCWIEHTRLGGTTYSDAAFREEFEVDPETKQIKRRPPTVTS